MFVGAVVVATGVVMALLYWSYESKKSSRSQQTETDYAPLDSDVHAEPVHAVPIEADTVKAVTPTNSTRSFSVDSPAAPTETMVGKIMNVIEQTASIINMKGPVCVSAPGKVLVAGGYTVLEHPNVGIAVATTSRFYTTVECVAPNAEQGLRAVDALLVTVDSPQFHTSYSYTLRTQDAAIEAVDAGSRDSPRNPFVEKCLALCFAFILQHKGEKAFLKEVSPLAAQKTLRVTLRAENDFYSQMNEVSVLSP